MKLVLAVLAVLTVLAMLVSVQAFAQSPIFSGRFADVVVPVSVVVPVEPDNLPPIGESPVYRPYETENGTVFPVSTPPTPPGVGIICIGILVAIFIFNVSFLISLYIFTRNCETGTKRKD